MFHFPTFPPHALCVQAWVTGHDSCRVSPFGHPRITARLTAPRGLSQPPTSFIGSWCQGIHRAPLKTWPQRCSRPLCSSQGTGDDNDGSPRGRPACSARPSGSFGGSMCRTARIRRAKTPEGFPFPQDPTACLRNRRPRSDFHAHKRQYSQTDDLKRELVSVPPMSTVVRRSHSHETALDDSLADRQVLLRKEVIQPHLPVRLPCYDFVPIADPTFDSSLHKGWATGFGCYRLS